MSFLTLEDVNTALYSNQGFWWHEIDCSKLPDGEFTDLKVDFCRITKRTTPPSYHVYVDNDYWTGGVLQEYNGQYDSLLCDGDDFVAEVIAEKLYLYMGPIRLSSDTRIVGMLLDTVFSLNMKELSLPHEVRYTRDDEEGSVLTDLEVGYNLITITWYGSELSFGYLLVKLLKTDFQFNCNQELINGKINTVQLGTDTDYLPDGDLIGEYTPSIRVLYNDETLPVTYDNTLNDYTFDLDLTEETTEHKIHLKVLIDSNEVLNSTSTDVTLSSSFETINTLDKLSHLFSVGGVGRLGSDLTLTDDLTVTKDVYIVGNEHTINMDGHKIMVPSDKIFKAEQTTFNNGENTIQQNEASKVELINCTFTDCTGLGSVIDCQIDVTSLDNPTDFTTILNKCTLNNNDMCILHGGNLTVTDSTINGKISDDKYPYFLYQTDGEAHITGTIFNLTHNTPITTDIGYNSCIFTIGEQATINYGDHKEYSQNNILGFLENSRNISIINVTYYYPPIEDYVTLQSTKGYCHSVSSVDFVFKTNVQLTRGD